ncbi:hypothetical protein EV182_001520 [Spiromyces aspiralis]|uniref:Uncharacterized protein n=1 Tax=Spiromyces aspiralis TaxID=68401 RepID=A0ACC1HN15_9FUNG|nr:hypothetical protein EV182_001520 [Spiromyces aspiralis]
MNIRAAADSALRRRLPITARMKLIDIGANLADSVFFGNYRGKQVHPDDFERVLDRARQAGVVGLMVTGTNLAESRTAIDLAKRYDGLFATVGCHPTRSEEFASRPDEYYQQLLDLIETNRDKVVAVGECGLDYDRLHFAPRETQMACFRRQFDIAEATGLPMFLHNRNTGMDFVSIVRENRHRFTGGVAHSFTGPMEEMRQLVDLGLYIGVNGCSFKTEENLRVAAEIPLDRLMLETDCPYCEVRPSHAGHRLLGTEGAESALISPDGWRPPASKKKERWDSESMVKSRNEPCMIRDVVRILARLRGMAEEEIAQAAFDNTVRVFFHGIEEGRYKMLA